MTAEKKKTRVKAKKAAARVEPLTVSVSLGATIPVGDGGSGGGFQYIRPEVKIHNICVDQPVEPQVKAAIEAARIAWVAIDTEIEVQIIEMVSAASGQPTLRNTLDGIQDWIDGVAKKSLANIAKEVKRHKEALTALEQKVGDRAES